MWRVYLWWELKDEFLVDLVLSLYKQYLRLWQTLAGSSRDHTDMIHSFDPCNSAEFMLDPFFYLNEET